jgi:adenylate cyclase
MKYLFFLLFLLNCFHGESKDKNLTEKINFHRASREVYYTRSDHPIDESKLLEIIKNESFIYKKSDYLTLGLNPKYAWFYFDINILDDTEWVLEILIGIADHLVVYQISDSKIYKIGYTIFRDSESQLLKNHPFKQIKLLPLKGQNRIFIEMKSGDALTLPMFLWKKKYLDSMDGLRLLCIGVYLGIMFSLAIYNFLLYLSIRDRTYLYYTGYILSFVTFLSTSIGLLGYVLRFWLDKIDLKNFVPFLAIITALFALSFSRSFLNLKTTAKRIYILIEYYLYLGGILLLLCFFVNKNSAVLFANFYPFLATIILICTAVYSCFKHYKPAYYFLFAWMGLIISVMLFILSNFAILEGNFITSYSQLLGSSFEAIMLSLALGYRINDLREKQELIQQQALEKEIIAREKEEKLKNSFQRFVPNEFLKNLKKNSILEIQLGDSTECKMCVLFTDIRGFTELSESKNSETVFKFLNDYLQKMEPIIKKYNGFIDKFIGDAIMAIFTEEEDAVLAAIEMLNSSLLQDLPNHSKLDIGIGIHSGDLILGTVGSPSRLDTTVIGDTVNLASRVESLNKIYGTKLLITEDVYVKLNSKNILIREIDSVIVKGKKKAVSIYEILV